MVQFSKKSIRVEKTYGHDPDPTIGGQDYDFVFVDIGETVTVLEGVRMIGVLVQEFSEKHELDLDDLIRFIWADLSRRNEKNEN